MPTERPPSLSRPLPRAAHDPDSDYRLVLDTLRLWGGGTVSLLGDLTGLDCPRVCRQAHRLLDHGLIRRAGSLRGPRVPRGLGGDWLAPAPSPGGVPGPIRPLEWPRVRASTSDHLRLANGRGLSARLAYTLLVFAWLKRAIRRQTGENAGCLSAYGLRVLQGLYDPADPSLEHSELRPYAVPDALVRYDDRTNIFLHVEIPYRTTIRYDPALLRLRDHANDAVLYVTADDEQAERMRSRKMFAYMPRAQVVTYGDEAGLERFLCEHQEYYLRRNSA